MYLLDLKEYSFSDTITQFFMLSQIRVNSICIFFQISISLSVYLSSVSISNIFTVTIIVCTMSVIIFRLLLDFMVDYYFTHIIFLLYYISSIIYFFYLKKSYPVFYRLRQTSPYKVNGWKSESLSVLLLSVFLFYLLF